MGAPQSRDVRRVLVSALRLHESSSLKRVFPFPSIILFHAVTQLPSRNRARIYRAVTGRYQPPFRVFPFPKSCSAGAHRQRDKPAARAYRHLSFYDIQLQLKSPVPKHTNLNAQRYRLRRFAARKASTVAVRDSAKSVHADFYCPRDIPSPSRRKSGLQVRAHRHRLFTVYNVRIYL
jgi:hypothetical protein